MVTIFCAVLAGDSAFHTSCNRRIFSSNVVVLFAAFLFSLVQTEIDSGQTHCPMFF